MFTSNRIAYPKVFTPVPLDNLKYYIYYPNEEDLLNYQPTKENFKNIVKNEVLLEDEETFIENENFRDSSYQHIPTKNEYDSSSIGDDDRSYISEIYDENKRSYNKDYYIKPRIIPKDNIFFQDEKQKERMDWNKYHRLSVIHEFMDDLESDFPSICTTGVIGKSIEGRDLKILKISNSDTTNESVWMDAGIHAREWIAPATATYIADNIVRNFDSLPEYITNKDWYFLPVMNPDGYEYSHTTDRMWRKNRAFKGKQCVGVDLNRNFSHGWGKRGSSEIPTHNFYRGPQPFSEPESSAVRDMLSKSGITFKVYLTLHSYGQVILFPFAFEEQLCPSYIRLLEGATVMSKAIYETSGNIYKVGISRDVMYGAAGTSNDWSHQVAGIPYCYLIELRSKKHKFMLPEEEISESGNEILSCVKALMQFVDEYEDPA